MSEFASDLLVQDIRNMFPNVVLMQMEGCWNDEMSVDMRQRLMRLREFPLSEVQCKDLASLLPLDKRHSEQLEMLVSANRTSVYTLSSDRVRMVAQGMSVGLEDGSTFFPTAEDVQEAVQVEQEVVSVDVDIEYESIMRNAVLEQSHVFQRANKDQIVEWVTSDRKKLFEEITEAAETVVFSDFRSQLVEVLTPILDLTPASVLVLQGAKEAKHFVRSLKDIMMVIPIDQVTKAEQVLVTALAGVPGIPCTMEQISFNVKMFVAIKKQESYTLDQFREKIAHKLAAVYELKGTIIANQGVDVVGALNNIGLRIDTIITTTTTQVTETDSNNDWGYSPTNDTLQRMLHVLGALARLDGHGGRGDAYETRGKNGLPDIQSLVLLAQNHVSSLFKKADEDMTTVYGEIEQILECAREKVGVDGRSAAVMDFPHIRKYGWKGLAQRVNLAIKYPVQGVCFDQMVLRKVYKPMFIVSANFSQNHVVDDMLLRELQKYENTSINEFFYCMKDFPLDVVRQVVDAWFVVEECYPNPTENKYNSEPETTVDRGKFPPIRFLTTEEDCLGKITFFQVRKREMVQVTSAVQGSNIYVLIGWPNAPIKLTDVVPSIFRSTMEAVSRQSVILLTGDLAKVVIKKNSLGVDPALFTAYRLLPQHRAFFVNSISYGEHVYCKILVEKSKRCTIVHSSRNDYVYVEPLSTDRNVDIDGTCDAEWSKIEKDGRR